MRNSRKRKLSDEIPKETEKYEVIGYVSPEPFLETGVSTQHSWESYRFTLVIIKNLMNFNFCVDSLMIRRTVYINGVS